MLRPALEPAGDPRPVLTGLLTLHVQVGPGADGRHAAAAEDGLALVVAGVAQNRAQDRQPAVEVAQAAAHRHAVLTPCDAELDERPGAGAGAE